MDKFIYAYAYDNEITGYDNHIKTIIAKNLNDAKYRIILKFRNDYEDIDEVEWDEFINQMYDKYGIIFSSQVLELDIL